MKEKLIDGVREIDILEIRMRQGTAPDKDVKRWYQLVMEERKNPESKKDLHKLYF